MTTQRKSTGASALIDIMKEVYETKLRMKEVIKQKIDTNSDDFEEYATLAHNAIVSEYNRGIGRGFAAGWHTLFPSDQITPDMYEEYYHEYATYTPSIPSYTTETDVDNLLVMMQDSKRCRLLLKSELGTNSNEFVTYPDLLEALYATSYQTGYDYGYEQGIEAAQAVGVLITQTYNTITMSSNGYGTIYYYFNDDIENRYIYTEPFLLDEDCTIHAYQHQYRITTYEFIAPDWTVEGPCIQALEEGDFKIYTNITSTQRGYRTVHLNKYEYYPLAYPRPASEWDIRTTIVDNECTGFYSVCGKWKSDNSKLGSLGAFAGYTKLRDANYLIVDSENGTDGTVGPNFADCINLQRPAKYTYSGEYYWDNKYKNCSSLLYAPEIPENSYFTACDGTFEGCTSLTYIPSEYILGGSYYLLSAYNMFKGCTSLVDARMVNLSNYWTSHSYGMFEGCTSLKYGPSNMCIGAAYMFKNCTSLVDAPVCTNGFCGCGYSMFEGCTSLVNVPDIYAYSFKLDDHVYKSQDISCTNMFKNCTSLVDAPDIYVTTSWNYSVSHAADGMFEGCTSLTKAPNLYGHSDSFAYMFKDCTSLVNPPVVFCDICPNCESMFKGCTSLTKAPDLYSGQPNYKHMFEDCTSLHSIKMLADRITYNQPYAYLTYWVNNTPVHGSFTKNIETTYLTTGNSGIPTGWDVDNSFNCLTFYSDSSFTLKVNNATDPWWYGTTNWDGTIEYSTDLTNWNTWHGGTISAGSVGNKYKLYLRGINNNIITGNDVTHRWVLTGNDVYCDGVLSSLLDYARYINNINTPMWHRKMFHYAFAYMFYGCTCLKSTPKLWEFTLRDDSSQTAEYEGNYIYSHMFEGCTGLTEVSDLPALELTEGCYEYMFKDCTSLTKAPTLAALVLTEKCYQHMFSGCTSLNYIKMIATDISATDCLSLWVENVAPAGTFVKQRNMNVLPTGVYGIPTNWTVTVR